MVCLSNLDPPEKDWVLPDAGEGFAYPPEERDVSGFAYPDEDGLLPPAVPEGADGRDSLNVGFAYPEEPPSIFVPGCVCPTPGTCLNDGLAYPDAPDGC